MDEKLIEYRALLVKADHQASLNFDKAIMTLSGGALGISMTFLHDVVPNPGSNTKVWLLVSWLSFAISLAAILISYLFSMQSLRTAMKQVDDGTIYTKTVGGFFARTTAVLRVLAALGFLVGVIGFLWFAYVNF